MLICFCWHILFKWFQSWTYVTMKLIYKMKLVSINWTHSERWIVAINWTHSERCHSLDLLRVQLWWAELRQHRGADFVLDPMCGRLPVSWRMSRPSVRTDDEGREFLSLSMFPRLSPVKPSSADSNTGRVSLAVATFALSLSLVTAQFLYVVHSARLATATWFTGTSSDQWNYSGHLGAVLPLRMCMYPELILMHSLCHHPIFKI